MNSNPDSTSLIDGAWPSPAAASQKASGSGKAGRVFPRFALYNSGLLICLFLSAGCYYHGGTMFSNGNNLPSRAARSEKGDLAGDLKKVELENKFGEVRVVASEDGSFGWTWKLEARAKTDALAEAAAAEAKLDVVTNGGSLSFTLVLPETKNDRSFSSDLEIRAPKTIAVKARNSFGAMTVAGVDGPVEARNEFGPAEVRGIHGEVQAQNSFAPLKVQDTGAARLRNQNGSLEAAGIHGALDAETSFAHLGAKDIAGTVKARNQNGSVTVERVKGKADLKTSFAPLVAMNIGGPVKADNQNGGVTIKIVRGNADVTTSFAHVDLGGVTGDATISNQNGSVAARDVTGAVRASTSFAAMLIQGFGRSFVCRNQNGQISLRAMSPEVSKIEAYTSFASLDLHLPTGLKPAISAHTSFANVDSDFPVLLKEHSQDTFAGVDPGTPRIILENQNGGIHIHGEKLTASAKPLAENPE